MKKILSLVLAVLLCGLSTSVWAEKVSKDEAAQLAGQFFSAKVQTAKNVKKAAPASTSAVLNAKQVASAQQLQVKGGNLLPMQSGAVMNKAASATLTPATKAIDNGVVSTKVLELPKSLEIDQFYIVQEEDEDGGWVIMAADDAVKPILGYCDKGTFDPSAEMPENLKWWLGMYNRQIKRAVDLKQEATDDVKAEWTELRRGVRRATQATEIVSPLLETTWNQGSPYNYLCPTYSGSSKSATGCVATAMSQVMNFWEWPTTGQGSHGGINFANTTYDWANMRNSYGSSYTNAQRDAVATLMYHVGMSIDMSYGASSGAYTINFGNTSLPCAQNSLSDYFKYNYDSIKSYYREGYKGTIRLGSTTCNANYASWTEANWKAMLKAELNKHRPIMYDGSGDGGGHSFVCDGYNSDDYFHFNWGWGGSYDGFFTVNNLAPGGGGIGSNNDNTFNEGQGVIIGIVPNVSDKYKVTYNVANGTLVGSSSWTQSTVGQSCTLPNVTPNDNYRFIGWTDLAGSKTANVGQAGDTYTPMRNVTLYAVMIQKASLVYFVSEITPGLVDHDIQWNGKPNWSGHGHCELDSLYEDGEGTGVVLPSVISDAGWTMQEWLIVYNSSLYIAGWPGDTFYPSQDTAFLYAYWTEDGKVYLDEALKGVVATAGPFDDLTTTSGWITQANGLNATFVAAEYYETLTASNTTVSVKVGGETISNCYSFANGVLTITLTPEQMIEDIEIAVNATVTEGWNCDSYSYTYTSAQGSGNNKTLGTYTWNITLAGNTGSSYRSSAQRFGGNNSKCTSATYTTTNPTNCLINKITINTWCTRADGTLEVWIGNTSLGTATLTNATADYTFTNPDLLKGQVKFVVTNASSGQSYYIYVKSINITMADYPDGSTKPADPIKVTRNFMYAGYYDYNEGEGDPYYLWQIQFYRFQFSGGEPSGYVEQNYYLTLFEANSLKSLAGTYAPGLMAKRDIATSSWESICYDDNMTLTITYKSKGTGDYSNYYIYHVNATWTDDDGQSYYIDDDVYTELANFDDDTEEVIPTGDTTPRYYKVNHWQQKVDGGTEHNATNYDLIESETGQGASGETFATYSNSYAGFISPADQPVELTNANTQNNPAEVHYYYDRRTYPISFVVENIEIYRDTVRYKATPEYHGPTPEREETAQHSYAFTGWVPVLAPIVQATTYTAQFTEVTYVTVTFNKNGHGSTEPADQRVIQGQPVTNPGDLTALGYTFEGWCTDSEGNNPWNFSNPVTADMTLYAKWTPNQTLYIVHHFQQNILDDGWTEILPVDSLYGPTDSQTNIQPAVKPYPGFDVQPYENVNISADGKTEVNLYYVRREFVIRFLVDGTAKQEETLRYGATPAWKSAEPTKDADDQFTYRFAGWDPTITTVKAAQDYNAKWDSILNFYTVSFDNNGHGGNTAPQSIGYGYKVDEPEALSETGWTFGGWYKEAGCTNAWNFATDVVNGPTTLYAKWTVNKHNLEWITDGDELTGNYTHGEVAFGTDIVQPNTPTKTGYTFTEWQPEVPETMPDSNLTLVAQWTEFGETPYTVKHFKQNLDGTYSDQPDATDNLKGKTNASVTPGVKAFTGFTAPETQTATILADGSLVIRYEYTRNEYQLTWNVNGEGAELVDNGYTRGSVKYGAGIKAPDNPTWRGHTFHGWDKMIPDTMPANNLTLTAQWTTDTYTGITFKSEDATEGTVTVDPDKDNYQFGDEVTITAEANDGYHFTGWSDGNTDNPRTITIDENTQSLTATFAPNTDTEYKVEHWLQNVDDDEFGILYQTDPHTGTTGALIMDSPLRIPGFMTPASQEGAVAIAGDGKTVIRYEYTRMSFDLTWDANGGTLVDNGYTRGSVRFGKTILAPATAEKSGYTFKGWDKEIPATMPPEAKRFTAVWEANVVEGVSFSSDDTEKGTVTVNPQKDEYKVGDVVVVTAEANDGYHFVGWSDGSSDGASRVVTVDENTGAIVAIFAPNEDTKFHIHVLLQNIDDDEFTLSKDIEATGITGTTVAPEPELIEGFEIPDVVSATIKGDGTTVIEQRYIRKKFELVWNTDGGDFGECEYTHGEVKFGANIIAPADPVKAHFIFIGWDQEIPETMPAENVTITALWEADPTGIEVVVDGRTIIGNGEIRIYDINGRDVTGWNGNLGRGFYIVVSGGVATKVAIQ